MSRHLRVGLLIASLLLLATLVVTVTVEFLSLRPSEWCVDQDGVWDPERETCEYPDHPDPPRY